MSEPLSDLTPGPWGISEQSGGKKEINFGTVETVITKNGKNSVVFSNGEELKIPADITEINIKKAKNVVSEEVDYGDLLRNGPFDTEAEEKNKKLLDSYPPGTRLGLVPVNGEIIADEVRWKMKIDPTTDKPERIGKTYVYLQVPREK